MEKSLKAQGELELLICANCSASGYKSCGDLGLNPFRILQEGDFIVWEVSAPESDVEPNDRKVLRFKFHRPQYKAEVERVIAKTRPA